MLKAIFTEISKEYQQSLTIGEKFLEANTIEEAHQLAKPYAEVLTDVKGTKVSYMLESEIGIIAEI